MRKNHTWINSKETTRFSISWSMSIIFDKINKIIKHHFLFIGKRFYHNYFLKILYLFYSILFFQEINIIFIETTQELKRMHGEEGRGCIAQDNIHTFIHRVLGRPR